MTTWPNWVDLVIVTILLVRCYNGFHAGALGECLKLIGTVCATVLTMNYAGVVADWLQGWFRFNPTLTDLLGFWLLLLALLFARNLLLGLVTRLIKWERVHWTIQGIGLALGALQGLWWSGLLLLALASSGFFYLRESVEQRSVLGARLLPISRESIERVSDRFPGAHNRLPDLVPPMKLRSR